MTVPLLLVVTIQGDKDGRRGRDPPWRLPTCGGDERHVPPEVRRLRAWYGLPVDPEDQHPLPPPSLGCQQVIEVELGIAGRGSANQRPAFHLWLARE